MQTAPTSIFSKFWIKSIDIDLQTSKIELVKINLNIENDKSLKKATEFINKEKSYFWNEPKRSEQAEIKKGIDQVNEGQRTSYSDVIKEISWWKCTFQI